MAIKVCKNVLNVLIICFVPVGNILRSQNAIIGLTFHVG